MTRLATTLTILFTFFLAALPSHAERVQGQNEPFSIELPNGWEQTPAPNEMVDMQVLSPLQDATPNFRENVNVIALPVQGRPDVNAITDEVMRGVEQHASSFQQIERAAMEIPVGSAERIVYTATIDGLEVQNTNIVAVTNGLVFIITCTATEASHDDYENTFHAIARSLRIEN